MPLTYLFAIVLIIAMMLFSVTRQKLTIAGAVTGGVIAGMIFLGAGYNGIAMLGAFFITGVAATSWKKNEKLLHKPVSDTGKRNAGQVFANGGVAAITGMLAYCIPADGDLFRLMLAGSLASAMADTLSSELGMVYGRRFYNIITWRKDEKGLDGVISLEGTLIGIAGSVIIAAIYIAGFGWDIRILFIIIAGTIGNLSDSIMGALFERKHYIGNDVVNFLNTFIAALIAWLLVAVY